MKKRKSPVTTRPPISDEPLFLLGTVVITLHALELLERFALKPAPYLRRYERGDFGNLSDVGFEASHLAVQNGGRIMSTYKIGLSKYDSFWIMTDESRSVTTIILPGEGP